MKDVQASRPASREYRLGDSVEVYSNSSQVWCKGTVINVSGEAEKPDGKVVTVKFVGANGGEMTKTLSKDHHNLRFFE